MGKKKIKTLSTILKTIRKIKKDCLELKRHDNLTEYGNGQLDLIYIILKN